MENKKYIKNKIKEIIKDLSKEEKSNLINIYLDIKEKDN